MAYQNVSGGLFVNFTHYTEYCISSFIAANYPDKLSGENAIQLKQAYDVDESQIVAPSVTFDFESAVPRNIETGSDYQKFSMNYLVDVIGRTQQERDFLVMCVNEGFQKGPEAISGYGSVNFRDASILVRYEVRRAPRNFRAMTLRARFEVDDFSE